MQCHVQVHRREIRKPKRCRLVGDPKGVSKIFNRQSLLSFGLGQKRDGCLAGHEACGRKVVDLQSLPEELVVADGGGGAAVWGSKVVDGEWVPEELVVAGGGSVAE